MGLCGTVEFISNLSLLWEFRILRWKMDQHLFTRLCAQLVATQFWKAAHLTADPFGYGGSRLMSSSRAFQTVSVGYWATLNKAAPRSDCPGRTSSFCYAVTANPNWQTWQVLHPNSRSSTALALGLADLQISQVTGDWSHFEKGFRAFHTSVDFYFLLLFVPFFLKIGSHYIVQLVWDSLHSSGWPWRD